MPIEISKEVSITVIAVIEDEDAEEKLKKEESIRIPDHQWIWKSPSKKKVMKTRKILY